MATSKDFLEYVLEQLSRFGTFSSRQMMGKYCIYYMDKLIGDICDNQFFLKPTPSVLRLMPEAKRDYPYEGSKTQMVIVDSFEDSERMERVISAMYEELPAPKKRFKKS